MYYILLASIILFLSFAPIIGILFLKHYLTQYIGGFGCGILLFLSGLFVCLQTLFVILEWKNHAHCRIVKRKVGCSLVSLWDGFLETWWWYIPPIPIFLTLIGILQFGIDYYRESVAKKKLLHIRRNSL